LRLKYQIFILKIPSVNQEVIKLESEIVILRKKDCRWCEDAEHLLDLLGKRYFAISISDNEMGAAIAKKACGGDSCLVIDGKTFRNPDKSRIAEKILD
jgi:hypothetical protein